MHSRSDTPTHPFDGIVDAELHEEPPSLAVYIRSTHVRFDLRIPVRRLKALALGAPVPPAILWMARHVPWT